MQAVLRGFYTTAIVNVITWNKAYALFPDATFIERKTYMLKPLDDYFGMLLAKYSAHGWTTLQTQWPEDQRLSHSLQLNEHRRVGDRKTWTITLDIEGMGKISKPDSVIEHACFAVETGERPEEIAAHFDMEMPDPSSKWHNIAAKSFKDCVLEYRYTFAGTEAISDGNFWLSLGERLDEMTYVEFLKMKKENRPELFEDGERERYFEWDGCFVKPGTWTHYDGFVKGWFEAWERGRVAA